MAHKIIEEDIKNIAESIKTMASKLNGSTVLLTGGAGFLGNYILHTLDYLNKFELERPCKVIVLDNFISGLRENIVNRENITLIEHDVSKPFRTDGPIDYILHAASIASPVFYNKYRLQTIDVGFLGTKNMLELAKEKNTRSFLFFSSSEVYGDPPPEFVPTNEEYLGNVSCVGPRSPYDEPKRIGETLCMTFANMFNLPIKIIRPFNIYGPGMRFDDGRVVPNFVVAALYGKKIPVYGHGKNTRTFCYISDAIAGVFQVLLSDFNKEIFNIGADNQEIEMRHIAEIIHGLIDNSASSILRTDGPSEVYTKSNPNRRCPDLTKIRTMLGYNPKVNLISGLKRFIAWAKDNMPAEVKYELQDMR